MQTAVDYCFFFLAFLPAPAPGDEGRDSPTGTGGSRWGETGAGSTGADFPSATPDVVGSR